MDVLPTHPFGDFMQLSADFLREFELRLSDRTLGMQAVRVLVAMLNSSNRENLVMASQKGLSMDLGMAPQAVSAAQKKLAELGFIERTSHRGWYRVSPKCSWKGSSEALRQELGRRGTI